MSDRTNAERNWETASSNEPPGRRQDNDVFRTESQRAREASGESGFNADDFAGGERGYRGQRGEFQPQGPVPGGSHGGGGGFEQGRYEQGGGGGFEQGRYEQGGGRSGYGESWQATGPSDYVEGGYYGHGERGHGRPPGFRQQGPGYGAGGGYNAEFESGDWGARPSREWRQGFGGYGMSERGAEYREGFGERPNAARGGWRGHESGAQRGGTWGEPRGGWSGGERSAFRSGGRQASEFTQDRDFGDEGSWGGGAGFSGGGQWGSEGRGPSQWERNEPSRGGGWGRGGYGESRGGYAEANRAGWSARGRGLGYRGEGGWAGVSQSADDWEGGAGWGSRGGSAGQVPEPGYGEPWTVPGPFSGRGPEGYQRSGDAIRDDVCERLTRHGMVDASTIRVRVEGNNEVVLEGIVRDRRTKRMAEDAAESVSGVRDVQNRLRVQDDAQNAMGKRGEQREDRVNPGRVPSATTVGVNETEVRASGAPATTGGHDADDTRSTRGGRQS